MPGGLRAPSNGLRHERAAGLSDHRSGQSERALPLAATRGMVPYGIDFDAWLMSAGALVTGGFTCCCAGRGKW